MALWRSRRGVRSFVLFATLMSVCPLLWRPILHAWGPAASALQPSYLPALETARERYPFDPGPLEEVRARRPDEVLIGDSMALRVDPDRLGHLTGQSVLSLMRFATGSAHWYLRFKNYVVASGAHPARVIVFFRDTQLTDPLFRLTGRDRFSADREAIDLEPQLNAAVEAHTHNPWFRVHGWIDTLFAVERTRTWTDPALSTWASARVAGRVGRAQFLDDMNASFGLDHLRPFEAADMAESDSAETDFKARVPISVLPAMLELARASGIQLAFVRVLRRPDRGFPPRESSRLRQYVRSLRDYLQSQGALYLDDRDVHELATLRYDDGDHILDEEIPRYTDLFAKRLAGASR